MKLSEETKKLFDAPWKVNKEFQNFVMSKSKDVIADCDVVKNANRSSHLPELYEALKQAVYDCCEDCLCALDEFNDGEYECDEKGCVKYDLIEKGCVFKERDCCPKCRSWIELLRKIKNGK